MSERVYNLLKKIHDDEQLKAQFASKTIPPQICNEYGSEIANRALVVFLNPILWREFVFSYYFSDDSLD